MSMSTIQVSQKLKVIQAQYDSMPAQERQTIDLAMMDLDTGVRKRAEANGNQAWFGQVSAIELLYELARFLNKDGE